MRAYVVPAGCTSSDELRRVDLPDARARPGQVVVRIHATSLNSRDQAVAAGAYFGRPVPHDLIPLSDGAGEIVAAGDGITRWAPGNRVVALFDQTPPDGPPFGAPAALGSPLDGTLAETLSLYDDGLLPIPDDLSYEAAACLPCAALTAWNVLMETGRPIEPGDTVLVMGTGGVSMFALQFALAAGARVIAMSSSDAKLERVKALGASGTVNYTRTPRWDAEVKRLTDGRGVDCIVEVGGAGTLERSFAAVGEGGKIGLVGVLTGRSADINPYALMWKRAHLHGIRVGTRPMFERMIRAVAVQRLEPVIDRVFEFDEAKDAYRYQASKQLFGKVVVRV